MFSKTEREAEETRLRPVDPDRRVDFTDEEFAVRLALAKKMCQFFLDVDETLTAEYRSMYERAPMWATYTMFPDGKGPPRRVFGVCTMVKDDTSSVASADGARVAQDAARAHVVTGLMLFNNDTIGGVPIADLEHNKVERFYYGDVMHTQTPGFFMDPLGFLAFIHAHHDS